MKNLDPREPWAVKESDIGSYSFQIPQPSEPNLSSVAKELLGYVDRAEKLTEAFMDCLYAEGTGPHAVRSEASSLDGTMRQACERMASLCGALATINARIGAQSA